MEKKLASDPVFDWYQATIREVTHEMVDERLFQGFEKKTIPGRFGYARGFSFSDNDFATHVDCFSGRNPGYHLIFTGCEASRFVPTLREYFPIHTVSRFDSAFDLTLPRMTYSPLLYNRLRRFAQILTSDRLTGREIIPSQITAGRTYYLGSPKSRAMIRIYEKGLQQICLYGEDCGIDPNWVRLELQLRPEGPQKAWASQATGLEAWTFSKFTWNFISSCFPLLSRLGCTGSPSLRSREFSDTQKIQNIGKAHGKLFGDYIKRHGLNLLAHELKVGYRKRRDLESDASLNF